MPDDCRVVDLRSGDSTTCALMPAERAWVSHAKLVPPRTAAAGQIVRVVLRTKTGDVKTLVLWSERNVVMVPSPVMLDEDFWLEREQDDCADTVVRFVVCDGNVDEIPVRQIMHYEAENNRNVQEVTAFEDDEDEDDDTEYIFTDETGDGYGMADDEEESDGESEVRGFMSVDVENQEGGGERQIQVLYRYTRFSAASSDGSVAARGITKQHQLRFIAAAGHGARSLAWAGESLAHLIYPDGLSKRFRDLWTSLVSEVSLPPGAARVKVLVQVGILRLANCTEASMGNMRDALKLMMKEPWPTSLTGMELNLPEPVWCGHDEDKETDDEQKPAKRRRVVATEEDCVICYELLKGDDLAAWPGCGKPHVFHGACMQGILESNPLCPMCRRDLHIQPKF